MIIEGGNNKNCCFHTKSLIWLHIFKRKFDNNYCNVVENQSNV